MKSPVEPEHELVQVRLHVLLVDAMECAINPSFQIGCHPADQRQVGVHLGAIVAHRNWLVLVAQSEKICELLAVVRSNDCPGSNALLCECIDGCRGLVRDLL